MAAMLTDPLMDPVDITSTAMLIPLEIDEPDDDSLLIIPELPGGPPDFRMDTTLSFRIGWEGGFRSIEFPSNANIPAVDLPDHDSDGDSDGDDARTEPELPRFEVPELRVPELVKFTEPELPPDPRNDATLSFRIDGESGFQGRVPADCRSHEI
jgi:hypothetical protein